MILSMVEKVMIILTVEKVMIISEGKMVMMNLMVGRVTMTIVGEFGDDTLTGGADADNLIVVLEIDTVTDFNADEGDTLVTNHQCENIQNAPNPPVITDPQNDDTVGCSFVITGTFDSDVHDQVEVFVDDSISLGNADVDVEENTWTFVVNVDEEGLTDGEHTFFVVSLRQW